LFASTLLMATEVRAGCGCTKPPPPPASVRPAFAWPGAAVTLFDSALVPGHVYEVSFDPMQGNSGPALEVPAVERRDLADGEMRAQLVVPLPELPLGPAAIRVADATTGELLLVLSDAEFTVAPRPIGVPNGVGVYHFEGYRAAVSRAGTVLIPLGFADIQHARVFEARAADLAMRFSDEDLAFYNVQGFLMQVLDQTMPGLFTIHAADGQESDLLRYSRHEFNSYFLQHGERSAHAVDPTDANWHLDGTPHIDHDEQVLAIDARWPNGSKLAPGATPPFELEIRTETLFSKGIVGKEELRVHNRARVRSYRLDGQGQPQIGAAGHVLSNGEVRVTNHAEVHGNATAASFEVGGGGVITGQKHALATPLDLLPVDVPAGLTGLGDLLVEGPVALGVGSYRVAKLEVKDGGVLFIENSDGPVTIYVTEAVVLDHGGQILTDDGDPEKLAIYLAAGVDAKLSDGAGFHGVVYGPDASVKVDNGGTFRGALVGGDVEFSNDAELLYYAAMHRNDCAAEPPDLPVPVGLQLLPGQVVPMPISLLDILAGWKVRLGGRTLPLSLLAGLVPVFQVPVDLAPGGPLELTLIDPNGCRSRRTVMTRVKGDGAAACGLLGIELAVVPLVAGLRRRRRR
jgi:hypothetical protein